MKDGRANRRGDGSGFEHRVARKSLEGSTPSPSDRLWSKEKLQEVALLASSRTDILRRMGLKKNKYRLRLLKEDLAALGLDTRETLEKSARHFTDSEIERAVRDSVTYSDVLRHLGVRLAGGSIQHYKTRIKKMGIDTSHFLSRRWSTGKVFKNRRKSAEETLVKRPSGVFREHAKILRRVLLEIGVLERCAVCGLGVEWEKKRIVLEVDHIDGDSLNNEKENLRFLCPNCHSQTKTYKNQKRTT